jgi:hypothetical protein
MLRLDARELACLFWFVDAPDARPHSQRVGVVARDKLRY